MNSLWFNFASLVQQSSQLLPYSASLKVMAGVWWFFVLLVVSAYTASMISFMTQSDNTGITTVEELVSQQEFDYGMLSTNPMLVKFLPQARDPPFSSMWEQLKKKRNTNVFSELGQALAKVNTGNFILIATFKEMVEAISKSCDYDKVGDGFYKYQYGFPVPRGWQFLPMLNDHMRQLYDKGIVSQLENKWFGDIEGRCETAETGSTVQGQLDLKAMIGMYVFLILGLTAGIVVCLFETAYVKYGGFGGFLGRAKKYEFRRDHVEHQRPDKLMQKEFEKWPGGWDVIKHRPFVSTISDRIDTKVTTRATSVIENEDEPECCPGCGQSMEDKLLNTA